MAAVNRAPNRRPAARGRLGRDGRQGIIRFVLVAALGALAMHLLDPHEGRRRRKLVRDQTVHGYTVATRRAPHWVASRWRYARGKARGIRHDLAHEASHALHLADDVSPDPATLAQRVRSEVFAPPDIPDGDIVVDAYGGVVTLRGQLPDWKMIDRVVKMTRHVEGVREVRNLLHPPGQPAPSQ